MKDLQRKLKKVQQYLQNDVKKDMGVQAVNHYRRSFINEGFTDKRLSKWQPVKRNKNGKGAARTRKILTESKRLSDSGRYRITARGVQIIYGTKYAEIHNKGGRAGRNGSAIIPKRQFIGRSEQLNRKISKTMAKRINRIMRM